VGQRCAAAVWVLHIGFFPGGGLFSSYQTSKIKMADNSKSIEQLEAELAALKAEKEALLESNTELQTKLEDSQATVEKVMTVVSDGKKKYELRAKKAQIKGKVYTAQEISKDKELVKFLVSINSGLLREL
jgi:predicted nuclease with TOPRIM domain